MTNRRLHESQFYPVGENEFVGLTIRALIPWKLDIRSDTHGVAKGMQFKIIHYQGSIHGGGREVSFGPSSDARAFINRLYPASEHRRGHEFSVSINADGVSFLLILNEHDDHVFGELRMAVGKEVELRIGTQGWKTDVLGKKSLYIDGYHIDLIEPIVEALPSTPSKVSQPGSRSKWRFI